MKLKPLSVARSACVLAVWFLCSSSGMLYGQSGDPVDKQKLNWATVPLLAPGSNVCFINPGQVIDQPNDPVPPAANMKAPDLVAGSVTASVDALRIRVRFRPGTFDPATTAITVGLDTDQDNSTGSGAWTGDFRMRDSGIGADYTVSMGSAVYGQRAQVMRFTGPLSQTLQGFASVQTYADGMDAIVPLSMIGSTDGRVNFRVATTMLMPFGTFSPTVDIMPDLGLAPGATNCLVLPGETRPALFAGGVVNAGSYDETPIAPGQLVTLFGARLGPNQLVNLNFAEDGAAPDDLVGVRVLFNGQPAPMIYAQEGQVSAVVPYGIAGQEMVQVQVERRGELSNPVLLSVGGAAPGLFTMDASGTGPGAILNEDTSINSSQNPAERGSIVVLYGTGEGATVPAARDGRASKAPLPAPVLPVTVLIGGQEGEVLYAGAAPGLIAGVLQVNVRVPADITPGEKVSVRLKIGDRLSAPGVTLSIK